MNRGTWWVTAHRVTQSQTRLNDLACTQSRTVEESRKSKLVLDTTAWIITESGVIWPSGDLKNWSWLWEIVILILVHSAFKVLMGPLGREITMTTEGGILEVGRIVWEVNCSKGRHHVKMLLTDLKEGEGRKETLGSTMKVLKLHLPFCPAQWACS